MVDSQYNPASHGASKITMVCPDCRNNQPGHWDITPLKDVASITPLFNSQLRELQQQHEQHQ